MNVKINAYKSLKQDGFAEATSVSRFYAGGMGHPIIEESGSIDGLAKKVAEVVPHLARTGQGTSISSESTPPHVSNGDSYFPLNPEELRGFETAVNSHYQKQFVKPVNRDSGSFFEQPLSEEEDPRGIINEKQTFSRHTPS